MNADRENHVDLFNREYQCRPLPRFDIDLKSRSRCAPSYPLERHVTPELADLIAAHSIHIAPHEAVVYARIKAREVGVKYSATGGDKAKAVRLAVREVLRLAGVTA